MKQYFFILLFLYAAGISAQRISLCKAYTDTGEPIDLIYSSALTLNQSVCILFSGENKKLTGKPVYLFIDRISGNERQNQFNKMFKDLKANWAVHVFKFIKEGIFDIYFTDENKNRFSALTVNVGEKKEIRKFEQPVYNKYPNAEITFCGSIQSGRPANIIDRVSLQTDGGIVYIHIENIVPFNTSNILINSWCRSKPGLDYDEFVDARKYLVERNWSDTFFKYKFTKVGQYKIFLYDEKELLIKTAYISVTN